MRTAAMLALLGGALTLHGAWGHGYATVPVSRTQQGRDERLFWCPHCVLAAPMRCSADECASRDWPGGQAFAEPGTAPSVTFDMGNGGGGKFGVCGTRDGLDFNKPRAGVWGDQPGATLVAGQVLTVEWCVNADHGGVYSWRLCDDEALVAKLLRSNDEAPLSDPELEELEACFQRGNLRCDAVEGQDCTVGPECDATWGCAEEGEFFHCAGAQNNGASYSCINTGDSCGDGFLTARRQVRIPADFQASDHTILSWRWDSQQTTEVFASCADVRVVVGNDGGAPTPAPAGKPTARPTVPAPTASSTVPVPAPTARPTSTPVAEPTTSAPPPICADSEAWFKNKPEKDCRWVGEEPESRCRKKGLGGTRAKEACPVACGTCLDAVPTAEPTMAPTMMLSEPTPRPSRSPTTTSSDVEGFCCFWAPPGADSCARCESVAETDNWCALNEDRCTGCGAAWCGSSDAVSKPSGAPSAKPTLEPTTAGPTVEPGTPTVKPTVAPSRAPSASPVETHGRLEVVASGGGLRGSRSGEQVQLRGMSLFWSNDGWGGERYYTAGVVAALAGDLGATVVRAAMGVEHAGGYLDSAASNKQRVIDVVEAALAEGLYVIIDWHSHAAEDHEAEAVAFFANVAETYGAFDNVIFEVYNEPVSSSWATIRAYASAVTAAIRAHSPNLVLVGSPTWSQDVDLAAADPLADGNTAYSLHFYAATHGASLRAKAQRALDLGATLFASEWGTVQASGDGAPDEAATAEWIAFLDANSISWANWALNDKAEGASALQPDASTEGAWAASDLTPSGRLVFETYLGASPTTRAPTTKFESPTLKPTTGDTPATTCCFWAAPGTDWCAACDSPASADNWCALSEANCASCDEAVWCGGG